MLRPSSSFFGSWLLALLSAGLLAAAAHAAGADDLLAPKPLPQVDVVLPSKPSQMLRAPLQTWQPVLSQAAAALDERVKKAGSLDKAALIDLHIQRTLLAQTRRDWPGALEALKQARAVQDNEASRLTSGLLNEALVRRAMKGGNDAWLRKQVRDQVLAMPWAEVESTIRSFRAQLADVKPETVETYVVNRMDGSAGVARNQVSLGFLFQLLGARFQLLEVMPHRDALVAGLDDAIAQRSKPAAP